MYLTARNVPDLCGEPGVGLSLAPTFEAIKAWGELYIARNPKGLDSGGSFYQALGGHIARPMVIRSNTAQFR